VYEIINIKKTNGAQCRGTQNIVDNNSLILIFSLLKFNSNFFLIKQAIGLTLGGGGGSLVITILIRVSLVFFIFFKVL
jgi:hypothetical protein